MCRYNTTNSPSVGAGLVTAVRPTLGRLSYLRIDVVMRTLCAMVWVIGVLAYGGVLSTSLPYMSHDECDASIWDEGVRVGCTSVVHIR